jgi:hypothetical protein
MVWSETTCGFSHLHSSTANRDFVSCKEKNSAEILALRKSLLIISVSAVRVLCPITMKWDPTLSRLTPDIITPQPLSFDLTLCQSVRCKLFFFCKGTVASRNILSHAWTLHDATVIIKTTSQHGVKSFNLSWLGCSITGHLLFVPAAYSYIYRNSSLSFSVKSHTSTSLGIPAQ